MNSLPADLEPGIKSELIDLCAVPLTLLRTMDDSALHQAMRHVVERTGHVRATKRSGGGDGGGGGERID